MNNTYTFVIVDRNYSETALICLSSFHDHNPNIKVHVYCVDFADTELFDYKERLLLNFGTNYSAIGISTDDMYFDYDWNVNYRDIINLISLKFMIMRDIQEEYICYFDIDTLFVKSISQLRDIIADYEFAGVRYNDTRPECNCGIFFAKNKHIDYYDEYIKFFTENRNKCFNIDECFLASIYTEKVLYLPRGYNTFGDGMCDDPIMIHYPGVVKPFEYRTISDPVCLNPQGYVDVWYDYFYSHKTSLCLSDKYVEKVEKAKEYIEKNKGKLYNPMVSVIDRIVQCFGKNSLSAIVKYMVKEYEKSKNMK